MPCKTGTIAVVLAVLLCAAPGLGGDFFNLPATLPPELYGTVLINRNSVKSGLKPVVFSHSIHRMKYTCRVCHAELDFAMETNATEITEMANRKGRFCGACHNGKISFKANGNCSRCHSGNVRPGAEKFSDLLGATPFPRSEFGSGIDWSEALRRKLINPQSFLKNSSQDLPFDKSFSLDAGWDMIPPAVFSHKSHTAWLDCSNCHPDIFNIKKKTTQHFSMMYILRGQFCGYCHRTVAFPMNDCKRCHPSNKDES